MDIVMLILRFVLGMQGGSVSRPAMGAGPLTNPVMVSSIVLRIFSAGALGLVM